MLWCDWRSCLHLHDISLHHSSLQWRECQPPLGHHGVQAPTDWWDGKGVLWDPWPSSLWIDPPPGTFLSIYFYFKLFQTIIFKTDRQANTSRFCTKTRHLIENSFAVLWAQKLSGLHHTIPQQLMGASRSQPTPQLPRICVWNHVINTVIRRNMKPFLPSYAIPPGMSYADVGRLTIQRFV